MTLQNNLYIIRQEPSPQQFILCMKPESEIYRAHFPEEAITPGACLVGIVKELAEKTLGHKLQIRQIKNLKFLAPLYPTADGPEVTATLKITAADSIQAELRTAETTVCKMSLAFNIL